MNLEYGYDCISDVNLEVTAVEITVTLLKLSGSSMLL
jgi:hypothetical protein